MPSTFMSIETARRGLDTGRTGMDVTGHNVANANTDGYTRQRAEQAASFPYTMPSMGKPESAMQLGTGVTVLQIQRIRDNFLDGQIRGETNSLGSWQAQSDALSEVETTFTEPSDNGISALMSNFWSSWQELSKNAESTPIRTTLVQNSVSLADGFNHTYNQLETVKSNLNDLMQIDVTDVNSKAQQIADLNNQIVNITSAGDQPNDLLDKRDQLLDELSKLTNFTVTSNSNGSIDVQVGSLVLVNGISMGTAMSNPPDWTQVTDGALYGINQALGKVQSYENDLNTMAQNLITQVNNAHTAGYDLSGNPGVAFFTGTDASNIAVNNAISADVSLVAAASSATSGAGDGSNALIIAKLQNQNVIGGTTLDNYYKNLIARLGVDTQESNRMVENQKALVDQLTNRKESISGVSMDEEMTNMIQYQYAYQGSARMVTVLDSMLNTLINNMAVS